MLCVCDGVLDCYILRRKGDSNVLDAEPTDPSRFRSTKLMGQVHGNGGLLWLCPVCLAEKT